MANTYRLMGDMSNCEAWAQRASAAAEERRGLLELGICSTTLGLIQRDRGQQTEAVSSLERAVQLLKESDSKRELIKAYFHLAEVYFSLKRKRTGLEGLGSAGQVGRSGVAAFAFGNLRVEMNGREVTDLEWRSEKGKEMFFFFLCNRRPLRKEEIVTALWPDLPEAKTTSLFHSNLYRLRQAAAPESVAKESGRYILDPQGSFWFDGDEFQEALKQADGLPPESDEAVAAMEKALACYAGAFGQEF